MRICLIYIPIWLDLLSNQRGITISGDIIYIPIWLDLLYILKEQRYSCRMIYIPIWLDLLYPLSFLLLLFVAHLHSNMVRFIITAILNFAPPILSFTFQYG